MKKAQVWQLDFLFAIVLSTITLILFVNFALDQTSSTKITDLSLGATSMSESLMTQGIPLNWTKDTIRAIGLLDENGRLDETKLQSFYTMTQSEYRVLLTQRNLYHIQLLQNNVPLTIAGKTFVGFNKSDAKTAMTISRFLLYDGKLTTLEVTVWK